eukprot:jgi/Hompol1/902/HPOL_001321-RA
MCFYDTNAGTSTCQFVVWDPATRKAAIIDPVLDYNINTNKIAFTNADQILAFVAEHRLDVQYILETHVHADHLTSSQYLKKRLGDHVQVCIGKRITKVQETFKKIYQLDDSFKTDGSQFDRLIDDDEILPLGQMEIKALHTPGHTPDHLAYWIGDAVFGGDTLFMPDLGSARCDFPGGSAELLYESIKNKIWSLPPSTRFFVGHDYPVDRNALWETTIQQQMANNKHVSNATSLETFVDARTKRDATLSAPKLLHFSLQLNMRAGKFDTVGQDGKQVSMFVRVPLKTAF